MLRIMCVAFLWVTLASPALAGPPEAEACRAGLSPEGQQMFDIVAPHVKAESKLDDLMRKHVRGMVMSGALSRTVAQANAPAVGKCLSHLKEA
jgi:hypothetical protein